MADSQPTISPKADEDIRPAFIVDRERSLQYATCLRHMLSGLAGQ